MKIIDKVIHGFCSVTVINIFGVSVNMRWNACGVIVHMVLLLKMDHE